jgi:integrase
VGRIAAGLGWLRVLRGHRNAHAEGLCAADIARRPLRTDQCRAELSLLQYQQVQFRGDDLHAPQETRRATLPLPDWLVHVLKAAKARQARERLAIGIDGGRWTYVVCNEGGEAYNLAVLSRYWRDAVKAAGIRHIKLHAARHTCATLMHLQGVPVAVIAAWIGHKDASLTIRLYTHSQDEALKARRGHVGPGYSADVTSS